MTVLARTIVPTPAGWAEIRTSRPHPDGLWATSIHDPTGSPLHDDTLEVADAHDAGLVHVERVAELLAHLEQIPLIEVVR